MWKDHEDSPAPIARHLILGAVLGERGEVRSVRELPERRVGCRPLSGQDVAGADPFRPRELLGVGVIVLADRRLRDVVFSLRLLCAVYGWVFCFERASPARPLPGGGFGGGRRGPLRQNAADGPLSSL